MADFVVGIDYLLGDDSDDSDSSNHNEHVAVKVSPPKTDEQSTKAIEKKQEPEEPELSGIKLLKSMYAKEEENRKRSTSNHTHSNHQKVKLKIKVGVVVDIYSSSRQQWIEGTIKEIKGDTICILYGNKMKWLHKKSKHFRLKQQFITNSLKPSASPPAAFSPVLLEEVSPMPSYDEYDEVDVIEAVQPPQPIQPAPPTQPIYVQPIKQRNMSPSIDHYEYDVIFTTTSLGLVLCAVKDQINCMVKQCVSPFAMKNVDPGSIVAGINGKNVMGFAYEDIRQVFIQNAAMPPTTVTFRSKLDGKGYKQVNNVNERGLLQIKVVGCMQLKHAAKYVSIKVGNAFLTTKELKKSNHHPEWMQVISFKNFRCDHGKSAIVTVYDKSAILKDKKIGSVEYALPIKFNSMQKDTVEIKNDKGKISGVIMLNAMVIHQK